MWIVLEKDFLSLQNIGDVEWFMLVQLPAAADFTQSEKGRERLLPDPTSDPDAGEFVVDWKEYVRPEIETQFTRDVATVSADLNRAEEVVGETGQPVHRLDIPLSHAETWYSVLNQARLILNEEHRIAGTERQVLSGERSPTEVGEKRWLVMVQYRVYAAIQEYILSHVMEE